MSRPAQCARSSASLKNDLARALDQVNQLIVGKPEAVELAFAALLAGGHLLIEDVPGVGKTTLAQALAQVLGGSWQRVQFTNDMLPADILGVSVFRRQDERFEFHPGPVFANVVLADEINRATPRTQSALLEAMAEGQVTIDGHTHVLPRPFFVIATQNPLDMAGTYPLPDSQLDRFLLRTALGYPSPEQERRLLLEPDRRELLRESKPVLDPARVVALIEAATALHVADPVVDYIQALIKASRKHAGLHTGLSTRAALALMRAARAHALVRAQDFCLPENVKRVFPALASHRLQPMPESGLSADQIVAEIIDSTAVP